MSTQSRAGSFSTAIFESDATKAENSFGFVLLPKEISDLLPRRGRTTVSATINEHVFQVTLEPDGKLSHWLPLDPKLLHAASVKIGDEVEVKIEPLPAEPMPKPPADFAEALSKHPAAQSTWDSTTAIAQVDWIHWIESGKQARTRTDRIEKACDMLESGKKRVCCFDPSGFYSKSLSAPKARSS